MLPLNLVESTFRPHGYGHFVALNLVYSEVESRL